MKLLAPVLASAALFALAACGSSKQPHAGEDQGTAPDVTANGTGGSLPINREGTVAGGGPAMPGGATPSPTPSGSSAAADSAGTGPTAASSSTGR